MARDADTSINAGDAAVITPQKAATLPPNISSHHKSLPLLRQPQQLQSRLPTPIDAHTLYCYLWSIHHADAEFLLDGFTTGFHIGYNGRPHSTEMVNHKSFSSRPDFVQRYISTEVACNRIAGPYNVKPSSLIISPMGLVAKNNSNTDFRVIQDFSMPKADGSINSGITDDKAIVSYELFDYVARMIVKLGHGCLIAKADIKSAFRICPVSPEDYHLLGFKVEGLYYHDRVLTMGCRSSCQIFERFSTALQDILRYFYNVQHISHILDDFIFLGEYNTSECKRGLQAFHHLAEQIGLPLKPDKTVQPTTTAVLHGILVNTDTMTASLPADKLSRVNTLLTDALQHRKITLKHLLSIIGLLQFASKVTPGGRCFLRRMIDLTCGVNQLHHFVRINKSARADLKMWHLFVSQYSGMSMLIDYKWLTSFHVCLQTDAAQSRGFGAVFSNKEWFYGVFTENLKSKSIALLEFIPIVIAIHLWADRLLDKCVSLATDNMSLVYIINKQTSKDGEIMILMRKLVLCLLKNNIILRAHHLTSSDNALSDAISRFDFQKARLLQPQLEASPREIPHHLKPCQLLREDYC